MTTSRSELSLLRALYFYKQLRGKTSCQRKKEFDTWLVALLAGETFCAFAFVCSILFVDTSGAVLARFALARRWHCLHTSITTAVALQACAFSISSRKLFTASFVTLKH